MVEQRSISIQNAGGKSSIKHNNREKELKNVDTERTEYNRTLVQENLREVYEREFGPSLERYNAKQKRDDRKIKDYFSHVRKSDSLELQREEIIQIGDKDNYSLPFGQEWEETADMYEEFFEQWKEQNPNLVPYNVVIHMDEASPHMHINYVPVAEGYKRGLEKQPSFSKALENQGFTGNKKQRFSDWRNQQLESIEGIMKEHSLERKEVGKNHFKNHYEYQEAMQEVENLRSERDKAQEHVNRLAGIANSLERKNEGLESERRQLETRVQELKEKRNKNVDILEKQKKEWDKVKEWKVGFNEHRNTSRYVQKIHAEPFMERTLTGKRESSEKVVVSKAALSKVEKTVNNSRQAQWIAESEFQDERAKNDELKKALTKERQESAYWREAWDKLNDRVEKSLEPVVNKLRAFRDWTLDKFEESGHKRATVLESFERDLEAEEERNVTIQRQRNDFDMER